MKLHVPQDSSKVSIYAHGKCETVIIIQIARNMSILSRMWFFNITKKVVNLSKDIFSV